MPNSPTNISDRCAVVALGGSGYHAPSEGGDGHLVTRSPCARVGVVPGRRERGVTWI